ncbi:hypothetical protein A0H81_03127 [Grifola frondosa]|uniref:Uncharacterized protein n=1 Tax=Grifola frondosa TaxID=5627 RepID=A0A1C7MHP0_GRIFR|nr:hypothetical protein A0H81_03127 [Grifola frondosa]
MQPGDFWARECSRTVTERGSFVPLTTLWTRSSPCAEQQCLFISEPPTSSVLSVLPPPSLYIILRPPSINAQKLKTEEATPSTESSPPAPSNKPFIKFHRDRDSRRIYRRRNPTHPRFTHPCCSVRSQIPTSAFRAPSQTALCSAFCVAKTTLQFEPDGTVPATVTLRVLRDARVPTHVLAILDGSLSRSASEDIATPSSPLSSSPASPMFPSPITPTSPLAVPIDAELFAQKFTNAASRLPPTALPPLRPVPRWDAAARAHVITLPVVPLHVPHPPSLASCYCLLATYLLPVPVIGEFPHHPAMAEALACRCADGALHAYAAFNQGLWRNVLALAPADPAIVDIAHVAWNVTGEARRLRARYLLS